MTNSIEIKVEKPTYRYKSPVTFNGKQYSDSKALVEALLNNWDDAITSFKCEEWENFWDTYVDAEDSVKAEGRSAFRDILHRMWKTDTGDNSDVLFTKVIHYFEPALKEIPFYRAGNTEVILWEPRQFRLFFARKLYPYDTDYLKELASNKFVEKWNRTYSKDKEDILYSCQMLREKVFTLFGYIDAEAEFNKCISGIGEYQNVTKEDLVKVYNDIEYRFQRHDEFEYKGNRYGSLEAFAKTWKDKCVTWSVKEWDEFIEIFYKEKKDDCSFRKWLLAIREPKLLKRLDEWKMEAKKWEESSGERTRSNLSENFPERKPIKLGAYFSRGSQKEHNLIIDKYEKEVELIPTWIKNQSKGLQVGMLSELYEHIFQYLGESIANMPTYGASAVKAELDALAQKWNAWEAKHKRDYEDKKMFVSALRRNDVLSCWDCEFINRVGSKTKVFDTREKLALFACAPIEESYQKNCEAFLKLIEAGGVGCDSETIENIAENIFNQIYMPLVDELDTPGEIIEYYYRFLEKLSEKFFNKTNKLYDLMSNHEYKNNIKLYEKNICLVEEKIGHDKWTATKIKEYRKKLLSEPMKRSSIDYKPFLENNQLKSAWLKMQIKTGWAEEEIENQSKAVAKLYAEWEEYFDENYNKKSIAELGKVAMAKNKEMNEHLQAEKEKMQALEKAIGEANSAYYTYAEARKAYEAEWDKRKAEEAEAEKRKKIKAAKQKALIEKVKKMILPIGVIIVWIFVFSAVINGVKSKVFTAWKVDDGVLVANLDSGSKLFNKEKFLDRVDAVVTDEGELTLPGKAEKIGNIGIQHEKDRHDVDKIRKLIIPEGVIETTTDFSAEGLILLSEIEFPASMQTITGNFNGTGLQSLYAENVTTISGTASFGNVFSGTECNGGAFAQNTCLTSVNLPSLQNVEDYAFYNCNALMEVTLPSAQVIAQHAFENCTSLGNVTLPSATDLNYFVFQNCTGLTTVNLPLAKTVCLSSFYGCENLQEVYLPTVETVYFNKSLNTGKIYIGSSVQLIDFQVVWTRMENGEFDYVHEKHNIEIVLDSNGSYSEEVLAMLKTASSDKKEYGVVKISYADFAELGIGTN